MMRWRACVGKNPAALDVSSGKREKPTQVAGDGDEPEHGKAEHESYKYPLFCRVGRASPHVPHAYGEKAEGDQNGEIGNQEKIMHGKDPKFEQASTRWHRRSESVAGFACGIPIIGND